MFTADVEHYSTCRLPPNVDECSCDRKKKQTKLKSACPCSPKKNKKTRPQTTRAKSPVASHLSPIRNPEQIRIIGPAGESGQQIESRKMYTPAGNKQAKLTNTIGTATAHDLDYKSKRLKKTKNVICECPREVFEREPKPDPVPSPKPVPVPSPIPVPVPSPIPETNQFEWVDQREVKKMKSDLTHKLSGFTMETKPHPPSTDEESTVDDALKHYAAIYPDLFERIVKEHLSKQQSSQSAQPPPPSSETAKEKSLANIIKISKKPKTKIYCEWPEGAPLLPLHSVKAIPPFPLGEASPFPITLSTRSESTLQSESQYSKGTLTARCLKIKISSKVTGSPGPADVYYYDLLQDSFTSW